MALINLSKKLLLIITISTILLFIYFFHAQSNLKIVDKTLSSSPAEPVQLQRQQPDTIILLSMIRSGSSILGSIFNERRNVTYFYEPLFPLSSLNNCDEQYSPADFETAIRSIATCEFGKLVPLYQRMSRTDRFSKCKKHHLCFVGSGFKSSKFVSRDTNICKPGPHDNQICPSPINQTRIQNHCKNSLLIALKVNYLCNLEWILPLLKEKKTNVKIVHLVRDPRSTINSRESPNRSLNQIKNTVSVVCNRLNTNLPVGHMMMKSTLLRNKYMRVRYEDFAVDPVRQSEEIYKFAGIEMTDEVKTWLIKATSKKNPAGVSRIREQSLVRNPADVLTKWRKELSFEKTKYIQNQCSSILKTLNYEIYENEQDYQNTTKLHFIPRW